MSDHDIDGSMHLHKTHEQDSHEGEQPEDLTLRERPLDLAAVRAKLQSKGGKQYWRTVEELAEVPRCEDVLARDFPGQAAEWDEAVDRRDFVKLMAASLAFAGLSGCKASVQTTVVPYVNQPDGLVLGKHLFFATAMPFGGDAIGVLVESHEGRPTKIEGNPDHPASLGGSDAITQASVLNLYDPDRAQTVTFAGEIRTWSAFLDAAQTMGAEIKAANGAGFRILTGTITSPSLAEQLQYLLKLYPQAKWHQWEPAGSDGAREGARLAFGRYVSAVYRLEKAEVILSLDSDFLATGPGHIRYMKDFYRGRKLDQFTDAGHAGGEMNRLYVVEPTPSVTGSSADHRLPLRFLEVQQFARALEAKPVNNLESLRELCADIDAGKVTTLLILSGNPVYDAPHDFDFTSKLRKVPHIMHVSSHFDETSDYSHWHVAESHYLEAWGDARSFDGTVSVIQPLIAPLYNTHSTYEVLAAFSDKPGVSSYDAVRNRLKAANPSGDFDKFWRKTLNDGVVANTAYPPLNTTAKFNAASLPPIPPPNPGELEFLFRPDPTIHDGRFANNGWLQELPKPVTKLVWDNAALFGPNTSWNLGVTHTVAARGGEHGQIVSTVIDIALSNSKVTAAGWIVPGQAEGVVVLPLGYGRSKAG